MISVVYVTLRAPYCIYATHEDESMRAQRDPNQETTPS